MERSPEIEAWAAGLIAAGTPVLHEDAGVVGKLVKLFLPGEYRSEHAPPDEPGMDQYVVVLSTGDHFLALPENPAMGFTALSPVEVQFLDAMGRELAKSITIAIGAALATKGGPFEIHAESALRLIGVALQGQLKALETAPVEGTEE